MKYKIGDKVTLTNGNIMTIDQIDDISKWYRMREDPWNCYTDEMIECKVEEETKLDIDKVMEEHQKIVDEIFEIQRIEPIEAEEEHIVHCPEGYQFKDENGNIINATKIVLEKKKKEYPKTYDECCKVLDTDDDSIINISVPLHYNHLLISFTQLLICRDAYWKIFGDWERGSIDYVICNAGGKIILTNIPNSAYNHIFIFPTEEMRDAFYECFKELIEQCKELL